MILLDDKNLLWPERDLFDIKRRALNIHQPAFSNFCPTIDKAEAGLRLGLVQRGLQPTFKILTVAVLPDPASASPNTTRKPTWMVERSRLLAVVRIDGLLSYTAIVAPQIHDRACFRQTKHFHMAILIRTTQYLSDGLMR